MTIIPIRVSPNSLPPEIPWENRCPEIFVYISAIVLDVNYTVIPVSTVRDTTCPVQWCCRGKHKEVCAVAIIASLRNETKQGSLLRRNHRKTTDRTTCGIDDVHVNIHGRWTQSNAVHMWRVLSFSCHDAFGVIGIVRARTQRERYERPILSLVALSSFSSSMICCGLLRIHNGWDDWIRQSSQHHGGIVIAIVVLANRTMLRSLFAVVAFLSRQRRHLV